MHKCVFYISSEFSCSPIWTMWLLMFHHARSNINMLYVLNLGFQNWQRWWCMNKHFSFSWVSAALSHHLHSCCTQPSLEAHLRLFETVGLIILLSDAFVLLLFNPHHTQTKPSMQGVADCYTPLAFGAFFYLPSGLIISSSFILLNSFGRLLHGG